MCTKIYAKKNCNPLICVSPLYPISPCQEFSVPRTGSFQKIWECFIWCQIAFIHSWWHCLSSKSWSLKKCVWQSNSLSNTLCTGTAGNMQLLPVCHCSSSCMQLQHQHSASRQFCLYYCCTSWPWYCECSSSACFCPQELAGTSSTIAAISTVFAWTASSGESESSKYSLPVKVSSLICSKHNWAFTQLDIMHNLTSDTHAIKPLSAGLN